MIDQDRDVDLVRVLHRVHALDGVTLNNALDAIVAPFIAELCKVRNARPSNGTLVRAVRTNGSRKCCKPAIGIAMNGDLVGIDIAILDQPGCAIILVVLHLQAPFAVASAPECTAPAITSSILRLHDDVSAAREILRPA